MDGRILHPFGSSEPRTARAVSERARRMDGRKARRDWSWIVNPQFIAHHLVTKTVACLYLWEVYFVSIVPYFIANA